VCELTNNAVRRLELGFGAVANPTVAASANLFTGFDVVFVALLLQRLLCLLLLLCLLEGGRSVDCCCR
jgi:hypothetical protein